MGVEHASPPLLRVQLEQLGQRSCAIIAARVAREPQRDGARAGPHAQLVQKLLHLLKLDCTLDFQRGVRGAHEGGQVPGSAQVRKRDHEASHIRGYQVALPHLHVQQHSRFCGLSAVQGRMCTPESERDDQTGIVRGQKLALLHLDASMCVRACVNVCVIMLAFAYKQERGAQLEMPQHICWWISTK
eukprot:scaffold133393_cov18-Tisochrysis_lutea.AAC.1